MDTFGKQVGDPENGLVEDHINVKGLDSAWENLYYNLCSEQLLVVIDVVIDITQWAQSYQALPQG